MTVHSYQSLGIVRNYHKTTIQSETLPFANGLSQDLNPECHTLVTIIFTIIIWILECYQTLLSFLII